jgi:hypothetical protein
MGQDGTLTITTAKRGGSEMKVTTLGIDLAKSVFQLHGVDARGVVMLRKQLRRNRCCRS